MQPLQAVTQHGAIDFTQDIRPHDDAEIGPDTDKKVVKRSMMQLAQGDTVSDDRIATRLVIRDDMDGIGQFPMPKAAKGTLLFIGG